MRKLLRIAIACVQARIIAVFEQLNGYDGARLALPDSHGIGCRDTGHTKYVIGEFGAALPVAAIVFAFYFWTRRAGVEPIKIAAVA
jgi:hypothetical protein